MKRHRMYNADGIAAGVQTVAKIRQKLFPFGTSPQLGAPSPAPPAPAAAAAEEPAEMQEGYCMSCKTKRPFQVEGEDKMPNGAIRKYGTSGHPDCGHKISHLVSGASSGAK